MVEEDLTFLHTRAVDCAVEWCENSACGQKSVSAFAHSFLTACKAITINDELPIRVSQRTRRVLRQWAKEPPETFARLKLLLDSTADDVAATVASWGWKWVDVLTGPNVFPPDIPDPASIVGADQQFLLLRIAYHMNPDIHDTILTTVYYEHLQNVLAHSDPAGFCAAMTGKVPVAPIGQWHAGPSAHRVAHSIFYASTRKIRPRQHAANQFTCTSADTGDVNWYTGGRPSRVMRSTGKRYQGFVAAFINPGMDWSILRDIGLPIPAVVESYTLDACLLTADITLRHITTPHTYARTCVRATLIVQGAGMPAGAVVLGFTLPAGSSAVPGYAVGVDGACMRVELLTLALARRPRGIRWLYTATAKMDSLHTCKGTDADAFNAWVLMIEEISTVLVRANKPNDLFHPNVAVNNITAMLHTLLAQNGVLVRPGFLESAGVHGTLSVVSDLDNLPVWTCPQMFVPAHRVDIMCAVPRSANHQTRWDRAGEVMAQVDGHSHLPVSPRMRQLSSMGPLTAANIAAGECYPLSGWGCMTTFYSTTPLPVCTVSPLENMLEPACRGENPRTRRRIGSRLSATLYSVGNVRRNSDMTRDRHDVLSAGNYREYTHAVRTCMADESLGITACVLHH
jgi:hypothetical protein